MNSQLGVFVAVSELISLKSRLVVSISTPITVQAEMMDYGLLSEARGN